MTIRIRAAALAAVAIAFSAAAAFAQPLPASAFARLPAMEAPSMSPDGAKIAALEHSEDGSFIVIRDAADFSVIGAVNAGDYKARSTRWAGTTMSS